MWLERFQNNVKWLSQSAKIVGAAMALSLTSVSTVFASEQTGQIVQAKKNVPVSVMTVEQKPYAKTVVASGIVRPISEQTLAFKVAGIVDQVLVSEGEQVKKGQLLAVLVLDEIDAQVNKAQTVLQDAKRQLKRIKTLEDKQLLSDETSRQAETAVEVAQSDLTIAKFNRQYAVIKAPADGKILTRHVEPHELIEVGQQAFVFADESHGWQIKMSVADIDAIKLQIGDEAQIKLDAYPGQVFTGQVREVAGRANPLSQTFAVGVKLNDAPKLLSGLIAHTNIKPAQTQILTAIPLTALLQADGDQATIYVLNQQGHAEKRRVKLAYLRGSNAMVSSGLAQSQTIVVQGGPFIVDGADIEVIEQLSSELLLGSAY